MNKLKPNLFSQQQENTSSPLGLLHLPLVVTHWAEALAGITKTYTASLLFIFLTSTAYAQTNQWSWESGDPSVNPYGIYGTKGTAASTNKPGVRDGSVSWTDASGNLFLFGGYGRDGNGNQGYLNDLWKWDGTSWTWISGDNTRDQSGNLRHQRHRCSQQ
jgi:hypothetical protein